MLLGLVLFLAPAALADDLAQQIALASRLPVRQACIALAKLETIALQADSNTRRQFEEQYRSALQHFQARHAITTRDVLKNRREARLRPPPSTTFRIADRATWPGSQVAVCPDRDLEVLVPRDMQPPRILVRFASGETLRTIGTPPPELLRQHPKRFARYQVDRMLELGNGVWSPGGLSLAFTISGVLCVQTLAGETRVLSGAPDTLESARQGPEGLWDVAPVWSPDGSALVWTRILRDRNGRVSEPRAVWCRLDGEEVTLGPGQAVGFGSQGPAYDAVSNSQVLLLAGETLMQVDALRNEAQPRASGAQAAALSPDGGTLAVVHVGRLGLVDLRQHGERAVGLPAEPALEGVPTQIEQPPYWLSPVQVAVTLMARQGDRRSRGVWIYDTRTDRFTRLADGYLYLWDHTALEVATSSGLLMLEYPK